ncbi:type II secretion system F family protein [Streptomyces paromomycinus]|uniref:Membrane protein n=1 Tax=Streptomyces paromomycinus TaxID=92743 RepID=A0A401W3Y6_STREY|nr:type II secretion system F family protein [Streptomyces paromomycinus]GCD44039.1 membrane protein [Streptomyces paromomycinus]
MSADAVSGAAREVVHTLGTVFLALATVVSAFTTAGDARGVRKVRRRAGTVLGKAVRHHEGTGRRLGPELKRGRGRRWPGAVRERAGPAVIAGAVAILVGGVTGGVLGLAVAYGAGRWRRRTQAQAVRQTAENTLRAALAPAADLLAACLAAGAGPRESAEAVGRSLGGTVGEQLWRVAAELRLGSDPATAWHRFGALPGARGLARCMERAGVSGVPAVEGVSRIAAELRAQESRSAAERARRAGVLVTMPLAACFLPAFLALGVVPVLVGLATALTQNS